MRSFALRRGYARFLNVVPQAAVLRFITACGVFVVIAALILTIFFARVRPIVTVLAKAEAREYVARAIYNAVEAEITAGNLRYDELVRLEKDSGGAICALVTDMAQINVVQSRLSNAVAVGIVNMMSAELAVPLGDVMGGLIFSGRGPQIPIRIDSVTDVTTELLNDFSSGGINQTRHKITLAISAEIVILVPGGRTSAAVATEFAIAETIIVGNVPNIYANGG